MAKGFIKDSKFHPIDKTSSRLHSGQLNLKSAPKPLIQEIKHQNIDSKGNFTIDNKKIPLEKISIFNLKNKQFILKGTNPSNEKTVTKIVKLK